MTMMFKDNVFKDNIFKNKVFKALSDPTRRRVLEILRKGPMAAGEISEKFAVSKPTMSAHFAVLREAGLVVAEKYGRTIMYRLKMSVLEDALFGFVKTIGLETKTDEVNGLAIDNKKEKT